MILIFSYLSPNINIFFHYSTQKLVPTLLWSSLAAEEAGKLSHSRSLEQLVVIDLAIDLILCSAPRGAHWNEASRQPQHSLFKNQS